MRSTFLLLKDIQDELKTSFENYPLRKQDKDNKEVYTVPSIWIGHVPPKRSMPVNAGAPIQQEAGDPPFILLRILDGEKGRSAGKLLSYETKIGIMCSTFSNESYEKIEAGYQDIMNMVDRALFTLCSKRLWGNSHWELSEKIKWTTGLQKELGSVYEAGMQEHPFYGAAILPTFMAIAPETEKLFGITDTKEV